jgi:hypothetical protein
MQVHRAFKRWVCGGVVMLLLFMQVAVAAYACPAELQAPRAEAEMAAIPGCDGDMPRDMDAEQPQLCKAHCQQGEQAVGSCERLGTLAAAVGGHRLAAGGEGRSVARRPARGSAAWRHAAGLTPDLPVPARPAQLARP